MAIRSSGIATNASLVANDRTSRTRICDPQNAPTIAAMPPRMQNARLLFAEASKHAPANEPVSTREISPGGAVRLGVFGRRSHTYSPIARTEKPATAIGDAMNVKG